MGRFGKWLKKEEVTIGGELITLKPILDDVNKLMAIQTRAKDKGMTDEDAINQGKIYLDIVRRGHPEEPIEELEAFITRHYVDISKEVTIALGWATAKDFEDTEKKLKKKE